MAETIEQIVDKVAHKITGHIARECCHRNGGKVDAPQCECRELARDIIATNLAALNITEAQALALANGTAVVVPASQQPDWWWRDLDPDDSGYSAHEALENFPDGMVSHLHCSFAGPSVFAARVPVLDPERDDTEVLTADTEDECKRLVTERYAMIGARP